MSESQLIEYKESWRDEYLKWIFSFANLLCGYRLHFSAKSVIKKIKLSSNLKN